jgi:peptidoglycan hydrolase-like protein with peptidoglycan-binding domain
MPLWSANIYTPVTVDGVVGPQTYRALQYGLGITVDGIFGVQSAKALQGLLGVTQDGVVGPQTVNALQTKLRVTQDGAWGPVTTYALQAALNAGTLGGATATPAGPAPTSRTVQPISVYSVTFDPYTGGGDVGSWTSSGMTAAGVSGNDWYTGIADIIIPNESSGNPNVANGWDLNAVGATQSDGYPFRSSRGLCQCIPPTFAEWHVYGTSNNIYDPIANVAAAVRYIMGTYGSIENVPGVRSVNNGGVYQGY